MQKILITGAASGLGKAIANLYADMGWLVLLVDIQDELGNDFVVELNDAGKHAEYYHCDVEQKQNIDRLFSEISNKHDCLDILVNNAGIASAGTLESTTQSEWNRLISLNLLSVIYGTQVFLPLLKKARKAHIISTASFAGIALMPGMMSYNVAKAGVIAFSETLHGEMALQDIGVSVVCPAFFQTNLVNSMRGASDKTKGFISKQMQTSKITADDVARDIQKAVANKTFMVISHKSSKRLYLLKRLFPNFVMRKKINIFLKLMQGIKK